MKRLLLNTLIGLALLTCQTSFAQKTKAKLRLVRQISKTLSNLSLQNLKLSV